MNSTSSQSNSFVHPSALCESDGIGEGTRIWAFAHVMSGAIIGRDCNIGDHSFVESGARVGDRVTIKNGVALWNGVTLEDDVFVGPLAVFTNDRHPRSPRAAFARERYGHVENWLSTTVIRQGGSIGAGAVILCGITIGRFAMIAAGAVVTRDVPDHALMLGNPSRQRGWVCRCGRSLSNSFVCGHCHRRYAKAAAGLTSLD